MKAIGHMERWGTGVLGVVSLALLVHLVLQISRGHAGDARPRVTAPRGAKVTTTARAKPTAPPGAKSTAAKPSVPDELSRYNSEVELGLLKQLDDRPIPELKRNPFEFVGAPIQAAAPAMPAQAPTAQPPPPPPITLKPMGYSEGKGGVREAMVSDEDQVFVVHEGDSVGTRYKVVKITPTAITVEDATIHQTVDLPIPQ